MNAHRQCVERVERCGEVIGVANGLARVRLESQTGCGGCAGRRGCSSAADGGQVIDVMLPSARTGDRVTLAIPAVSLTAAAMLGYLWPPVCLLAGAIAAQLAFASDTAAVVGAAIGLLAGLLCVRIGSEGTLGRRLDLSASAQASIDAHASPSLRPQGAHSGAPRELLPPS